MRVWIVPRITAVVLLYAATAVAQTSYPPSSDVPNPYHALSDWARFPDGRKWGSASAIAVGPDGNIWVAERCGGSSCAESDVPPIVELDPSGKVLKSFGAGLFALPHGFFVDDHGNVWVTDATSKNGKGEQVTKLSPEGKVLLTLGKAGTPGKGPDLFTEPTDVVVNANGDIFVSDGHDPHYDSSRVVKFSKDGKYIKEWGAKGTGPGQFMGTHGLAIDSNGRLFVADRGNSRVEIFDQDGNFIAEWKQFGRPSGIFIDRNDILYVADSESTDQEGEAYNPGCMRGIRIGSVKDGKVTAFIPGPAIPGASTGPDGVAADFDGNVYAAEVRPMDVQKFVRTK